MQGLRQAGGKDGLAWVPATSLSLWLVLIMGFSFTASFILPHVATSRCRRVCAGFDGNV